MSHTLGPPAHPHRRQVSAGLRLAEAARFGARLGHRDQQAQLPSRSSLLSHQFLATRGAFSWRDTPPAPIRSPPRDQSNTRAPVDEGSLSIVWRAKRALTFGAEALGHDFLIVTALVQSLFRATIIALALRRRRRGCEVSEERLRLPTSARRLKVPTAGSGERLLTLSWWAPARPAELAARRGSSAMPRSPAPGGSIRTDTYYFLVEPVGKNSCGISRSSLGFCRRSLSERMGISILVKISLIEQIEKMGHRGPAHPSCHRDPGVPASKPRLRRSGRARPSWDRSK